MKNQTLVDLIIERPLYVITPLMSFLLISRLMMAWVNILSWDEAVYFLMATDFPQSLAYTEFYYRPPGYPFLLFIFGLPCAFHPLVLHLVNLFLYICGNYFLFLLVKELEDETVARAAVIVAFLSPALMFLMGLSVMSESLFWLLSNSAMYFYVLFLRSEKIQHLVSSVVLWVFCSLTRFNTPFLIIILVLIPFYLRVDLRGICRRNFVKGVITLAISLLFTIPYLIHSYFTLGDIFSPFKAYSGAGFESKELLSPIYLNTLLFQMIYVCLSLAGVFVLHFYRQLFRREHLFYWFWFFSQFILVILFRPNFVGYGGVGGGNLARLIVAGFAPAFLIIGKSVVETKHVWVNPILKRKISGIIQIFSGIGIVIILLINKNHGGNTQILWVMEMFVGLLLLDRFWAGVMWCMNRLNDKEGWSNNIHISINQIHHYSCYLKLILLILVVSLSLANSVHTITHSPYLSSVKSGSDYLKDQEMSYLYSKPYIMSNTIILSYYLGYENVHYKIPSTEGEFFKKVRDENLSFVFIHRGGLSWPTFISENSSYLTPVWNSQYEQAVIYAIDVSILTEIR